MLSEAILLDGNLSIKLISLLLIIFQMKSATKRLKSQKRASWTKFQNGSGEIAAISPSVNSNIWRRYFPANSIWHATSARYWRGDWKWLNFRSETGFKTNDTKRSIALTTTRNKQSRILQSQWKVKRNFIPASTKRLAEMRQLSLVRSMTARPYGLSEYFDNARTPFSYIVKSSACITK